MLDKLKLRIKLLSRFRYILAIRIAMRKCGLKYVNMLLYEQALHDSIPVTKTKVPVEIKPISAEDVTNGHYQRIRLASGDDPRHHGKTLSRLASGDVCFIARVKSEVAGFSWLYFQKTKYEPAIERREIFTHDEALLYDRFVFPKFRRLGIGVKLNEQSLRFLKSQGFLKAKMYVEADNLPAIKSSELVGFYPARIITCLRVFKFKRIKEHPIDRRPLNNKQAKTAEGKGLTVEPLQDEEEWERFVASSPQATFYHTLQWEKALQSAFPVKPIYLVIRDCNGELVAICPFVIWKELKVIKVLDSLWHSDYGGPLIKEGYAEPAMSALIDYLKQLAHEKGITYARIRCCDRSLSQHFATNAARIDTSTGTMMLDLGEKPTDFMWNEVFTCKGAQRKYIRRFERRGYQIREAEANSKDLAEFYTLYYKNITYIGGSPYHFDFFKNIWSLLYPTEFNILLAKKDGKSIGALGFYIYKCANTIYLAYLGLDRSVENTFHTSYYLYWNALQWAERFGYRYVSFGSTLTDPREVHHRLKSKFGAEFNQDYIVYLPFKRGWLLIIREKMLKLARKTTKWLPKQVVRRMVAIDEGR